MQKKIINVTTGEEVSIELTEEEILKFHAQRTNEIPSVVTMRQARLALLQQGYLSQVQTAIDSLPSPQKEATQIEWDYSSEVHRDKPFVQSISVALGLTEEQLDSLFITASQL